MMLSDEHQLSRMSFYLFTMTNATGKQGGNIDVSSHSIYISYERLSLQIQSIIRSKWSPLSGHHGHGV